jgi:hypothetical protein
MTIEDDGGWGRYWGSPVGYGRPPKHSQFKPGQSGNLKGRKKKRKDLVQMAIDAWSEPMKVRVNGVLKTMSYGEAIVKTLYAKAANGDQKARAAIFKLMENAEADAKGPFTHNEMIVKIVGPNDRTKDSGSAPLPKEGLIPKG